MHMPPYLFKHVRKLARNILTFLLAILLAFGGVRPRPMPFAYADEGSAGLTAQASAKPFMNAPSKKPDFPSLTATNWMSGLDNGRYLSEVNIPGAHDACTQHMLQAMSELKAVGQSYAECQDMQYQDMINNGVRVLDLRLNNWYLIDLALPAWAEILIFFYGLPAWLIDRIIEWIIETTDANKVDDGKNCYMVHGDNSWGRTFWVSKDDDYGNYITLNNVLDTCKSFLSDHPSETIILYLADETTDSEQVSRIRARAKGILQGFANEINPATGESYLYMEGGTFANYTKMPKVGDVRGKVVIASNSPGDYGIGMSKSGAPGYEPGTTLTYNEENNYDVGHANKYNYLLAPAYLETLADGSHAIVANFDDGVARSGFTISAASAPGTDPTDAPGSDSGSGSGSMPHVLPNTSDPLFGAVLLFLPAASVALYLAARRLKMGHVRKR